MTTQIKSNQWGIFYEGAQAHIVPMDDLREHDLSDACWCEPTRDAEVSFLVVHNSMDKRELYDESTLAKH